MKKILFSIGILYFFSISCANNNGNSSLQNKTVINKFTDTTIQQIMELRYERNTEGLLKFVDNKSSKYRETVAMAFGSVQDTMAITKLSELLSDKEPGVRIAAAFAIGQTGHASGAGILYTHILTEKNDLVKNQMLEAIGKCGDEKSLQSIIDLNAGSEDDDFSSGKAIALARFSIRGIFNNSALNEIIKLMGSKKVSSIVKYNASIALTRMKLELSVSQLDTLIAVFKPEKAINTKLNIVLAAGKNKSVKSKNFLISVLNESEDYRLRINALRSLSVFEYKLVNETYFLALYDSSVNVAIRASEYFLQNGQNSDTNEYYNHSNKMNNWRVVANLLTAALKYSDDKERFSEAIKNNYLRSQNNYEKAWLLKALGGDLSKLEFVKDEVFSSEIPIIRTSGIEALVNMRTHNQFEQYNKKLIATGNSDLEDEFATIFKDAILSGDVAMISIASGAIRNPELNLKSEYENIDFLTQAISNCELPRQIEAYIELQKTIDYINGTETATLPEIQYKKLNWDEITKIKPDQKIEIITSKGNFMIQLNVEDNPATVAAIIELIKGDFYKNKHIHRVVPNFVIQDGCPRGDGWGSPDFSIKSEFYNSYYEEGSFGMASAGKDTESSQWFVTHSPTPHLDGRYTMFGKVVEGLEVVHKIEVGDEIKNIRLIEE
ncbi:MAG: peptidylprolyl isomerase [Bacteroidota bacterium]